MKQQYNLYKLAAITSADVWTVIRSVSITIPDSDAESHRCVATGSADVDNPAGGSQNNYRFTLSRNNANPGTDVSGSDRLVSLTWNLGNDDQDYMPVSTNAHSSNLTRGNGLNDGSGLPGKHTFYLLGRKASGNNTNVRDAALSVICVPVS
jgi:hypothetical protein